MPTNDERREVAARLRVQRPKSCLCAALGWEIACEEVECCEDCNMLALARLADLVDHARRPRKVGNEFGLHDIHCGECRNLLLVQRDGTEEWPSYCCQCGTRVEEGA